MLFKRILGFLILLSILVGCSNSADHIDESETISKTISAGSTEPLQETIQSVSNNDATQTERNTKTVSRPTRERINEEPESPLASIYLSQTNRNISDKTVSAFFDFFMKKPIYYAFHTENELNNHSYDVVIALDEPDRSYMKINDGQDIFELVSSDTKQYFLLDETEQTAREIKPETVADQMLYLKSFQKMNELAQHLYYVGSGKAVFYGQQVEFEEYTQDNEIFIRYYFEREKCLGFRTFMNQKIQSETKINSLYHEFPDGVHLFDVPDSYQVINLKDPASTDLVPTETGLDETMQETETLVP